MGSAISRNVTKETFESMISVFTDASIDTYTSCSGLNYTVLEGCHIGGDVDIDAFAENAASENTKNDIENIAKQKSESVSQMLQLSSSQSENLYNAMVSLGTSIQNSVKTDVTTHTVNENAFRCKNTEIEKNLYVNQNNIAITIEKLISKNASVVRAQQNLKNTIDQYSKASVSGFAFFLIFLIVALMLFGSTGTVMSSLVPFVLGICTIIGTVYTARDCLSKDKKKVVCKTPLIYYVGSGLIFSFIVTSFLISKKM
jgi:hypothetical protein